MHVCSFSENSLHACLLILRKSLSLTGEFTDGKPYDSTMKGEGTNYANEV